MEIERSQKRVQDPELMYCPSWSILIGCLSHVTTPNIAIASFHNSTWHIATYSGTITRLEQNQIFVFGSNTQGRHGKGAALTARTKFGAIYG